MSDRDFYTQIADAPVRASIELLPPGEHEVRITAFEEAQSKSFVTYRKCTVEVLRSSSMRAGDMGLILFWPSLHLPRNLRDFVAAIHATEKNKTLADAIRVLKADDYEEALYLTPGGESVLVGMRLGVHAKEYLKKDGTRGVGHDFRAAVA
jgi:hypothetical protein